MDFLVLLLGNLGRTALGNVVTPFARGNLSTFGWINWWSDWNSTAWNKKKNKRADFLELCAPLATSLAPPVISSVVKGISGRGIRRAGRRYMNTNF